MVDGISLENSVHDSFPLHDVELLEGVLGGHPAKLDFFLHSNTEQLQMVSILHHINAK